MTVEVNTDRTTFASGEVSPNLHAADDLARYKSGLAKCENMVVLMEGVLTRSPGTGFVDELKTQSEVGRLISFRYSSADYYVMLFNAGVMRLYRNGGRVETSPGVPFELSVPWGAGELEHLRAAPVGNKVFVTRGETGIPRVLTRSNHTSWSIADYVSKNGPVGAQNLDPARTVRAAAVSGNGVALTGSGHPFNPAWAADVIMRLDEPSQSIVPLWQVDEEILLPLIALPNATATYFGDFTDLANAFDGNNATVASSGSGTKYIGRLFSVAGNITEATISLDAAVKGASFSLYGKTGGAPAHSRDGVKLGTYVSDIGDTDITLASNSDQTFTRYWVRVQAPGAVDIKEIKFLSFDPNGDLVLRRWQSNVYQALTQGSAGFTAPVHTEGDLAAGQGEVVWRYLHSGYGYVRLTNIAGTNTATGDILSRLPDSVVDQPTYRWSPPAWNDVDGWPDNVIAHDQRLEWIRGDSHWFTRPGTTDDFLVSASADSAIPIRLTAPDGALVEAMWAYSQGGIVVLGTRDMEWMLRAPQNGDALTVTTIRPIPDTKEGSIKQVPAPVDKGVIFIGRSGKRLHYAQFNYLANALTVNEVSSAARHIVNRGASKLAWQRDPNRILWGVDTDGKLFGITFMPEEKVIGWHRHPRTNAVIEDIVSIPASGNEAIEVYMVVRRTIGGATKRYLEILKPFFDPGVDDTPDAEGAWFVDSGLRYQGAPATTISGLSHLEGETVAVFADGAELPARKVVTGGAITLDHTASDVIVGIPVKWRIEDLPRNIMLPSGTSKGDPVRASSLIVDVLNAGAAKVQINSDDPVELIERGDHNYDAPLPLVTGPQRVPLASATADQAKVALEGDNALPFTLRGITPTIEVERD